MCNDAGLKFLSIIIFSSHYLFIYLHWMKWKHCSRLEGKLDAFLPSPHLSINTVCFLGTRDLRSKGNLQQESEIM